jgi:hypothetical protein
MSRIDPHFPNAVIRTMVVRSCILEEVEAESWELKIENPHT